jgi:hypothetical protein
MKKILTFLITFTKIFKTIIEKIFVIIITQTWNIFSSRKMIKFNLAEAKTILHARSSKWRTVRNNFLEKNPYCAVCGSDENLIAHHIIPVHIDKSKELDENNLMTLCQNKTMNCHFIFGHLLNWTKSNPEVIKDSKIWQTKLK